MKHIKTILLLYFILIPFVALARKDFWDQLYKSIENNDITRVEKLANCVRLDKYGTKKNPLDYALELNRNEIALSLIKNGAIQSINNLGELTTLHMAEDKNFYRVSSALKAKIHKPLVVKQYTDYAIKNQSDTAVLLVGYNRPEYFQQLVDSLSLNPESETLPFFLILDGGRFAKHEEYIKIFESSPIKNKHIIIKPFNYGCQWNIVDSNRFMFEQCKFKRILHFEDDIVVAPNYISLVLNMNRWARSNFANIGVVQASRPCNRLTLEKKLAALDAVLEHPGLYLGYCIEDTVWHAIKPILYEYEEFLMKHNKPAKWGEDFEQCSSYHKWITAKLNARPLYDQTDENVWQTKKNESHFQLARMSGGQDTMLTFSLHLKNYIAVQAYVNRSICIGKHGVNFNEKTWRRFFGKTELDYFPEDGNLKTFRRI